MPLTQKIAFLGGGVMTNAVIRSLLDRDLLPAWQVVVSDILEARRQAVSKLGVRVVATNADAVAGADVVIAAVKPQDVPAALQEVRGRLQPEQLLVSIAPGLTVARLEELAGGGIPVIRVMPNTPLLVGAGATGFCRGPHAGEAHAEVVRAIFEAGGRCVEVPEKLMDAVTGLSGSGPAYVCLIIEALADGGVSAGLPRDTALTLAAQTVLGAARLVLDTGDHPGVWKDRVGTPGGTTMAGLGVLEEGGLRGILIRAVEAAARRSEELGGK